MSGSPERVVISLGGSLIVPDSAPDTSYLKKFKDLILKELARGKTFFITTGGGKVTRVYQDALRTLNDLSEESLDWVGISATRLNAQLVREMFASHAARQVVTDPTDIPESDKEIIVGAGWKPGWSTDYVAVQTALTLGAKRVINLTNTGYVYDKDPGEHSDAQPLQDLTWSAYRAVIPEEWTPGLSTPFDPVASRLAEENNLQVAIIDGSNLESARSYINKKEFEGTLIHL